MRRNDEINQDSEQNEADGMKKGVGGSTDNAH